MATGGGAVAAGPSATAAGAPRGRSGGRRGILSVLFRNEVRKTLRRPAFWVTWGLYAFVLTMAYGEEWYRARNDAERVFALPSAWPEVFGEETQIGLIFGCVVLILLVASEFSWRTARQNVIDGLSKEAWFGGKVLLAFLVGAFFVGTHVAIGGGFALAGTDPGAVSGAWVGPYQLSATAGFLGGFLGYASLALLTSLHIRSTGGAMAAWFFYVAIGEGLLQSLAGRFFESARSALRFLPVNVFNQFHRYRQHDPVALEQAVQRAVENDRPPPEVWEWEVLLSAGAAWIALFLLVSFVWFRRRDL